MQKKILPLLILPVVALASCGSPSTTTIVPPSIQKQDAGDQTMSTEEAQLLSQLNAARAVARSCGSKQMPAAPAVTWNGYLASAARAHALDMATRGFFDHVNPDGIGIDGRANAAGYTGWREVAENIAAGQSVNTVMQAWLNSPSHCETLMDGGLKEVGIAYLYRPGTKFGTYFVQDFGVR